MGHPRRSEEPLQVILQAFLASLHLGDQNPVTITVTRDDNAIESLRELRISPVLVDQNVCSRTMVCKAMSKPYYAVVWCIILARPEICASSSLPFSALGVLSWIGSIGVRHRVLEAIIKSSLQHHFGGHTVTRCNFLLHL